MEELEELEESKDLKLMIESLPVSKYSYGSMKLIPSSPKGKTQKIVEVTKRSLRRSKNELF